ncbi:hypothetical protein LY78DRAFT_589036, partial [Colletotrichum sublineola]
STLLKSNLCIISLAALLCLFCFIDRSNIGKARLAGLEKGASPGGLRLYFSIHLFLQDYWPRVVPSKTHYSRWLTCKSPQSLSFGYVNRPTDVNTIASAYVNNYSQLAACRFILGIEEASITPGLSSYLSRFYRHSELTSRLSLYIVMTPLAGPFGGLLASAILKLKGFGSQISAGSW